MTKTVFLAGATGAIGRRIVPLLLEGGYDVAATTRSAEKANMLSNIGVRTFTVDVFDSATLVETLISVMPQVVIHQLTDLPAGVDPARASEFAARNARIRKEGTANLVKAAQAAKVGRIIAQSIAWAYAPHTPPHDEDAPLDLDAPLPRSVSVGGVVALEDAVLRAPEAMTGLVLRYGHLYGPGTGADAPDPTTAVHVDAAAHAAVLAIENGTHGIYNISEPSPNVVSTKASGILGWDHRFRLAGEPS